MWRSFQGFPIQSVGTHCVLFVRIATRMATRHGAFIGLVGVTLLFGVGCRSQALARVPRIKCTQILWTGVGRPNGTQNIGSKLTGADGLDGPQSTNSLVFKQTSGQSTWFCVIFLAVLLISAILLYRLRMFRTTRQLNIRFQERLAERTRIAQELHDTLLQGFQGLLLRFQTVNDTVLSDPAEAKELMERALERADQVLAESRRAIQGIRSAEALGRDLSDALNVMMNELVEEFCFGKAEPLMTLVTVEGQPRKVASSVSEEACRIAREALWNSFSHARAQRIESEIAYSDKFLRLRFRDDGIGIDSEILKNRGRAGHWGVIGMYERARSIHGSLNIWSKPNAGTEVELTIPAYMAYEAASHEGWVRQEAAKEQAIHDHWLSPDSNSHC